MPIIFGGKKFRFGYKKWSARIFGREKRSARIFGKEKSTRKS